MYYLFLDESGDHGLSNVNPNFPIFVLCGVLFEQSDYEECRDKINQVKNQFWGNKDVIFHSRDIRKCQKEFQILSDLDFKRDFMSAVNAIITTCNYTIIADGIDKHQYIQKYVSSQMFMIWVCHL